MKTSLVVAAAVLVFTSLPALAHITLEVPHAAVGAGYKAVLRVPHGCEGKATTALKVQVPEGYIGVKPMPKPGWALNLVKGDYAKTYSLWGHEVTSGVKEIDWTGGNLPDDEYDEFVLNGSLSGDLPTGSKLYFKVVQECGADKNSWIMIPKAGQDAEGLATPAPGLMLEPAKADSAH